VLLSELRADTAWKASKQKILFPLTINVVPVTTPSNYPTFAFLFLSFSSSYFLLAQQPPVGPGLLLHEVSRSRTTTYHSRLDCSGRVISSSQRVLPDNTQHSQQTDRLAPPMEFEPTVSAGERPQTYALDRAATGTGFSCSAGFK
jgi:hypothetical protein